eukprot:Gb_17129 [translate_table: standard]
MVSIALFFFRPNPDFVSLFPCTVVEPDRLDSFSCAPPVASRFVPFFLCTVVGLDRPDFPKCPPPALPGIESRVHLQGLPRLALRGRGTEKAFGRESKEAPHPLPVFPPFCPNPKPVKTPISKVIEHPWLLPFYLAFAKCFPITRSLWGGQMVGPSDSLLSRKARWEDLTVVSYTACPVDWTPGVKMSFSVSSLVRWVIGPILSPRDPSSHPRKTLRFAIEIIGPHLETGSRLAPEEGGGYHNQGRENTGSGRFAVLRIPTELLAHASVLVFVTEQEKMMNNTPTETKAKEPAEGASIHQRRLQVLSEPCWIVTHHTALQPNLYCGPHREGDKVKALDPLQAPMCTCSSPPIKQRCCSIHSNNILPKISNNILPEIGECLSLPHFLRITQVLGPCPPLFSPTLRVTLPAYRSDFPSCASCSFVISPVRIEGRQQRSARREGYPFPDKGRSELYGRAKAAASPSARFAVVPVSGHLQIRRLLPISSRSANKCFGREYVFPFSSLVLQVLLFRSRPAPTRAIKAFSRLNRSLGTELGDQATPLFNKERKATRSYLLSESSFSLESLGYTFPERSEGKAWVALSSRACVLGSFCVIGPLEPLVYGLEAFPYITSYNRVESLGTFIRKTEKGLPEPGKLLPFHCIAALSPREVLKRQQCASGYPFPEHSEGKAPSEKLISFRIR